MKESERILTDRIFTKLNIQYIIFFSFLMLFMTCGFFISFYNEVSTYFGDSFFNADGSRIYNNFFNININDFSPVKHPLVPFFLQPLFRFFDYFFRAPRVSFIFTSSFCGASIVIIIYKILSIWTNNNKLSILMSVIYGISFSTLIFISVPELYIFSALSNSLLFLYLSLLAKKNTKLKLYDYFNIAVLTLISFGIMVISLLSNCILILWLLGYINKTNEKKVIKDFIIIITIAASLFLIFSIIQARSYQNMNDAVFLGKLLTDGSISIYNSSFKMLLYSILAGSFYALKINTKDMFFYFQNEQDFWYFIPVIFLWSLAILCYAYKTIIEKKSNSDSLAFALIIIFILNMAEFFCYHTSICFLFSQNVLIYIIILLGLMLDKVLDKFVNISLFIFIVFQLITNSNAIIMLGEIVNETYHNYYEYLMYPCCIVFFLFAGWILLKKISDKFFSVLVLSIEEKFNIIISIYMFIVISSSIFLGLFKCKI